MEIGLTSIPIVTWYWRLNFIMVSCLLPPTIKPGQSYRHHDDIIEHLKGFECVEICGIVWNYFLWSPSAKHESPQLRKLIHLGKKCRLSPFFNQINKIHASLIKHSRLSERLIHLLIEVVIIFLLCFIMIPFPGHSILGATSVCPLISCL